MIPSAQLIHRDSEAIGNRNQRVAATHRISLWTRTCDSAREGDDELISRVHAIIYLQSVCTGNSTYVSMRSRRNTVQGLAASYNVKPPTRALILGDIFDTRCEDIKRANRNVQVKRRIAWCGHSQQARIQCND